MRSSEDQDVMLFLSVERVLNPARGRFGGGQGAAGRIRVGEDGPDLPGKGEIRVKAGDTLIFETPGGAGFGDPHDRPRDQVQRDLDHGLISRKAAQELYGAGS
jgi:N-methylhydantoinase B